MVAAARAAASRKENALIDDPFAEPLVAAVGVEPLTKLSSGEIDFAELEDDDDEAAAAARRFADAMAVRTKYFDDFFLAATGAAGIRQAVILASGLDSRAYRLPWPDGTVVFEIDQPRVLEFKTNKLAELGANPKRTIAPSLSTCVKTGPPRCAKRVSTPPNRRRG